MDIKAYGETQKAIVFSATFEDFKAKNEDAKVREWQEAYFELMSLKNTYSAFYSMDIIDYRISQGVYSVKWVLVVRPAYDKSVSEWLDDYFNHYSKGEYPVAVFETLDITDTKGNEIDEIIYGVYEG